MLSDYRYRKAREIVKSARIGEGGKRMLFCALRQYRKNLEPRAEIYQETILGKKTACLVGAALADVFEYQPNPNRGDFSWIDEAVYEFGVRDDSVENLISGFDHNPQDRMYDRSRYAIVGQRLRKFLIGD